MSQIGIWKDRAEPFARSGLSLSVLARGLNFPRERAAILGVALALALSLFDIALFVFDTPAHMRFTVEDGFVENLTVVFWLMGGGYVLATLHLRKGRMLHLFLGLAMVVMAGEEISWGQRLFSFATPAGLDAINVQHEFNLHNISGIHESIKNIGLTVILAGTVLLPFLERSWAAVRRLVARFRIPMARADVIALVLFCLSLRIASRVIWHTHDVDNAFDEISELVMSLAFLLLALDRSPIKSSSSV